MSGYPGAPPPPQAYSGYGPPADPQVIEWFEAVDEDGSGVIDAHELSSALSNADGSQFSFEACQMMIGMFDADRVGQININEFGALFDFINQWKAMFESLDRDQTGMIDEHEFAEALGKLGYRFSPQFVSNLVVKYSPRERRMTLEQFIVACVQIRRLTDSFRTRDADMRGQATLQYEDFVGLAMGAHV